MNLYELNFEDIIDIKSDLNLSYKPITEDNILEVVMVVYNYGH